MILDALHKLANHCASLTRDEARQVMTEILRGEATQAQMGALLVALHMKGETVDEIVGLAQAIRAEATPLQSEDGEALASAVPGETRWSIPAVRAAIPAAPSISRLRPLSLSQVRGCELPNTVIAASAPSVGPPMLSRHSE